MNLLAAFMLSLLIFGQTLSGLGAGGLSVVCVGSQGHVAIERSHVPDLGTDQAVSCCGCPETPDDPEDCVDVVLPDDDVRGRATTSLLPLLPIGWPCLAGSCQASGSTGPMARAASPPPPWPPPNLGRLTGVVLQV